MAVNDGPESVFKQIILINQNDGWGDPECWKPGTKIEAIENESPGKSIPGTTKKITTKKREEIIMSTLGIIILVVVLFLVFGGGGGYYWRRRR
jgi:hypothetical protein